LDPSSAYDLLETQTGHRPAPNRAGAAAAAGFLFLVVLLLASLKQLADLHQLLLAGIVLASVNVPLALFLSAHNVHRD
jgi:hypothetical protein